MFNSPFAGLPVSTSVSLSGNPAQYLDGSGTFSVPGGSGAVNPSVTNNLMAFSNLVGGLKDSGASVASIVAQSTILLPASSARNVIQPTGAGIVPLTSRGFAGQTAHLFETQTSAGAVVFSVDPAGVVNSAALTASQAVLTDGSKNLVSVATTGTGSVARANAPTFTGILTAAFLKVTGVSGLGGPSIGTVAATVYTTADNFIGVIVRGNSATQSGALFLAQDNLGNNLFAIGPTGNVTLTAPAALDVGGTVRIRSHSIAGNAIASIDSHFVLGISETITPLGDGRDVAAIDATATATTPYANKGVFGAIFEAGFNGAGAANWAGGVSGAGYMVGSGTIARAFGVQGLAQNTSTGGTMTLGYAGQFQVLATGTNSFIGTAVGVYIDTPSLTNGSTITGQVYGIYIENQTGGIGQHAIYTNSGLVHFGDHVDLQSGRNITLTAGNIVTDTIVGTKIGTVGGALGQLLGFFGSAPVTQPLLATGAGHTSDDIISVLQNLGLVRQS